MEDEDDDAEDASGGEGGGERLCKRPDEFEVDSLC